MKQEILKHDGKNYKAYLLLGAIHQDKNPSLVNSPIHQFDQ